MATRFYIDGHTYLITSTAQSWNDAGTSWSLSGGHLAIISSLDENTKVYDVAAQGVPLDAPYALDGGSAIYLWLGASDILNEGSWNWVNGAPISHYNYTNWGSGVLGAEPDNTGGFQDAMAMGIEAWPYPDGGIGIAGEWNDLDPSNELYSIIEWDFLYSFNQDDQMNGTSGVDIARFNGFLSDYSVTVNENIITVIDSYTVIEGGDGTDTLSAVERLGFLDTELAFDMEANGGIAAKIIGATFDAESLADADFVGEVLAQVDAGVSYDSLMVKYIEQAGAFTNEEVVDLLFENVVGWLPNEAQSDRFVGFLETGKHTVGSLGVLAAEHRLNDINIDIVGLTQTGLEYVFV